MCTINAHNCITGTASLSSYGSTILSSALQALETWQSLKATARQYGIPAKTLRHHRDDKVKQPRVSVLVRHRPNCLSAEIWGHASSAHFGDGKCFLYFMDIRQLAFDHGEKMMLQHPFSKSFKLAGSIWLRSFLFSKALSSAVRQISAGHLYLRHCW